jgi:hypothetical protein
MTKAVEEAVRWYEARRAGLRREFFDAVAATFSLIESNPEGGTSISTDGQTRRTLVARFPCQVVYRLSSTEMMIVANRPPEAASWVLERPKLSIGTHQKRPKTGCCRRTGSTARETAFAAACLQHAAGP